MEETRLMVGFAPEDYKIVEMTLFLILDNNNKFSSNSSSKFIMQFPF